MSEEFWSTITDPVERNHLVALVRAFRDHRADFVYIDDRCKRSQIEGAEFAESLGLITREILGSREEQYTQWRYRLTKRGRIILLDPRAPNVYTIQNPSGACPKSATR